MSELLVAGVAAKFPIFSGKAVVVTGGMPGVQEVFAKNLKGANDGRFEHLYHLVPKDFGRSNFGVGEDVACGDRMADRVEAFCQLGSVYLTFEGGPRLAEQATKICQRGGVLIPLASTGGASAGMFEFPQDALQRPDWAPSEPWAQLSKRPPTEAVSDAVIELLCKKLGIDPRAPAGGWQAEIDRLTTLYKQKAAQVDRYEGKPATVIPSPCDHIADPEAKCQKLLQLIGLKEQAIRMYED